MDERAQRISELLHDLVHELVESERALAETAPGAGWEDFYADRIIDRFG
jgi:hypothetical protein